MDRNINIKDNTEITNISFNNLGLNSDLLKKIESLGFEKPTLIQEKSIPLVLEKKDVIGESATGSGKTIAFGIGAVSNKKNLLHSLIIVPTRELAEQVKNELLKININNQKIIAVYGGVNIDNQIKLLRRANILVATPGRLLDHINRRTVSLNNIELLVLDEADRMIDMGFINDIEEIISFCPNNRQTLLFSATMNHDATVIAKKYMRNPSFIRAKKMVDPKKLKQHYYQVPHKLKNNLLLKLLTRESSDSFDSTEKNLSKNKFEEKIMIFCNTRKRVDFLVSFLRTKKIFSEPIHGGLTQNKRLKTIDNFHKNKFSVLVCTDVAARGLHIEKVSKIINYDIPSKSSDYVHRIGRTARAGNFGKVINLLSNYDYDSFSKILNDYNYDIILLETPFLKKDIPSRKDYQANDINNHFKKDSFSKRSSFRKNRKNTYDDFNSRKNSFQRNKTKRSNPNRYSKRRSSNGFNKNFNNKRNFN